MGELLIVGLIIGIIVLVNKNDELSKEIKKLKNNNPNTIIKYCPNCGVDLTEDTVNPVVNNKIEKPVVNNQVENDRVVVQTKPKNDKSIKNSFILIAGALLIIISAITLLTLLLLVLCL